LTAPRERQPNGGEWLPVPVNAELRAQSVSVSAWQSGPIRVISSLTRADAPDGSGPTMQWHVSVSNNGKRPKPHHLRRALRAFSLVGSEEDNHHPGNARHFWLPLDPSKRVDCECKTDEVVVVDPDGYKWTNPHEAAKCRGFEFAREPHGRPCPIHSEARI
jgi:hypothetical protein